MISTIYLHGKNKCKSALIFTYIRNNSREWKGSHHAIVKRLRAHKFRLRVKWKAEAERRVTEYSQLAVLKWAKKATVSITLRHYHNVPSHCPPVRTLKSTIHCWSTKVALSQNGVILKQKERAKKQTNEIQWKIDPVLLAIVSNGF